MRVAEHNDLRIRLTGTAAPSGEIALSDLAALASSLQELATRVARHVVGQHGPGRTVAAAARVVDLRLTGLRQGSTVLDVSFGESNVLPLKGGPESDIADRFWEVVGGIQAGVPPQWASQSVRDSAVKLVDAFAAAADEVAIQRADGRTAAWRTARAPRTSWLLVDTVETERVTVVGRLEKVDLADRRFRIRDDVGNTITLEDVDDAEVVGPLVGQRTAATGAPVRAAEGRLRGLRDAAVEPAPVAAEWRPGRRSDLDAIFARAPGPDPAGLDLSDEEISAFLAALDT